MNISKTIKRLFSEHLVPAIFLSILAIFGLSYAVYSNSTTIGLNIATSGNLEVAGNATTTGNQVISGNLNVHGAFSPDSFTFNPGSIFMVNGTSTFSTTSFLGDVNFNLKQIKNVVLEKLSNFPSNPVEGQMFWSTVTSTPYWYDATNSRWRTSKYADTIVVAASDSKDKEKADYVCDGANDQVEIQAAINAMPIAGGRILLLAGTYNLVGVNIPGVSWDTPIFVTKSNITIEGQGNNTLLNLVDDNGLTLLGVICVKGANDIVIKNLSINGGLSTGQLSGGIYIIEGQRIRIENVYLTQTDLHTIAIYDVTDGWIIGNKIYNDSVGSLDNHGIDLDYWEDTMAGNHRILIADNIIENVGATASKVENSTDITYSNNTCIRNSGDLGGLMVDRNNGATGISTQNISYLGNRLINTSLNIGGRTGGVLVDGNYITGGQIRVWSNPTDKGVGATGGSVVITDNYIEDSKDDTNHTNDDAIQIYRTMGNHVISNNIINNSNAKGIAIDLTKSTTPLPASVNIENNMIYDPVSFGIYLASVSTSTIQGNKIYTAERGIYFTGSNYNMIDGNYIYYSDKSSVYVDSSYYNSIKNNFFIDSGKINYSSSLTEAGSSDYNRYLNNWISDSCGNDITTVGLHSIKARNTGYTTENSGTATISSGNTSTTVSHGLKIKPAISTIAVIPTNNLGSATKFWVSNVATTTFQINTNVDPGASDASFSWQIGSY